MDRRQALKKLAVGGAIAAGGSLVLSSNAVASTGSGPGVPGIPTPSNPALPSSQTVSNGVLTLTYIPSPELPPGTTITYQWRIESYNISQNPADGLILLTNGSTVIATGQPTCTSCALTPGSQPGGASATVQTFDNKNNGRRDPKKFKKDDLYTIWQEITWQIPRGAGQSARIISAVFAYSGVIGGATPQATMLVNTYRDSG